MKRKIAGYGCILAGLVLLPLPGPGLPIIVAGVAMVYSGNNE